MAQANLLTYFQPKQADVTQSLLARTKDQSTSKPEQPLRSKTLVTTQPSAESAKVAENGIIIVPDEPWANQTSLRRPLDPRAQITRIDLSHLASLKRLTSSTLPVRYSEKFFSESVGEQQASDLSRVVLYDEKPVGWIRCRLETTASGPSSTATTQIYIQALCLLAPYRNYGLATELLNAVLDFDNVTRNNASFVYAHVWENNEDALAWYEKRNFKRTMLVDQYYRRLKPSGAWIVRKELDRRSAR